MMNKFEVSTKRNAAIEVGDPVLDCGAATHTGQCASAGLRLHGSGAVGSI